METWYTYAIMALFFMGTQRFLYRVSAEKRCNTAWTPLSFMSTVTLLSSILFLIRKEPVTNIQFLLFIGFLNSAAFLAATITHIEALKYVPVGVAYPIIRLNTVIVVLFSIFFFNEQLSFYQVMGIIFAVAVIVVLTKEINGKEIILDNKKLGFILVFISTLSGSIASITSKFAAIYTNKIGFIAVSYMLSTLFSLGLRKKLQTSDTNKNHKDALIIGTGMGVINFAGYYSFLKALSMGPLSIIVSLTGMHFVIAILLSVVIYKEKLTSSRIIGILLAVVSVILLRL
ncbi:MAG: EamA family transporter [Desulfobacterales bacterium]|nr:EamA family transporter [Desulfobacterales bacterium]